MVFYFGVDRTVPSFRSGWFGTDGVERAAGSGGSRRIRSAHPCDGRTIMIRNHDQEYHEDHKDRNISSQAVFDRIIINFYWRYCRYWRYWRRWNRFRGRTVLSPLQLHPSISGVRVEYIIIRSTVDYTTTSESSVVWYY